MYPLLIFAEAPSGGELKFSARELVNQRELGSVTGSSVGGDMI